MARSRDDVKRFGMLARRLAIASMGVFVVSLDSAINIAFPSISRTFGIGPAAIQWVAITYVLTYAPLSLVSGWLADRVGHAKVFAAGLWVNALGCTILGLAPTYGLFLLFRVVLGVGAGLVYGSAPALVTLAVPPAARGRGLGLLNLGIALGFTLGPAVGGLLVDGLGWRWVYFFRVLPAVLVVAGAALWLQAPGAGERSLRPPFWGAFTREVLRATLLTLLANVAAVAVWLLGPYYLVDTLHQSATLGGLFFMLNPLGAALTAPLSGWGADRLGPRGLMVAGLGVESAGFYLVSQLDAGSHAGEVGLALLLAGIGLGAFTVPNMSLVMGALPVAQQGVAGGMVLMMRTFGVVLGAALTGLVFGWRQRVTESFIAAFHDAMLVVTAVCFLAFLVSLMPIRKHR